MSNPTKDDWKYEAFPKSQREKRIAELEAESAKLNRDVLFLRGACVKPDAVDDYLRVCRRRAELEAENARLRKVADAAVAWFACEDSGDVEANVYMALHDAVREYRKELPRISTPDVEVRQ